MLVPSSRYESKYGFLHGSTLGASHVIVVMEVLESKNEPRGSFVSVQQNVSPLVPREFPEVQQEHQIAADKAKRIET